jgi:hypothetical protein
MNPKKIVALLALLPLVMLTAPHIASADITGRQLRIASLQAFKYQGYQPLDVLVQVTDEYGTLVSDANVVAGYDTPTGPQGKLLKSLGKGMYLGCDIDYLDGPAKMVVLTAAANKKGMKETSASARANVGNLCGAGEAQILVQQIQAAKPDGKGMPLSILVRIIDETGRPVLGAKVLARATDFHSYVDAPLIERGDGYYVSCAFAFFDTKGEGAISIHVRAESPGLRNGSGDTRNVVGSLCTNVFPPPPPNSANAGSGRALSSTPRRAN